MASKIRKGDEIIVLAGKDKGKRGTVLSADAGKVTVDGVNVAKKHVKPNPAKGEQGGIVEMEMPLDASNVALYNATSGKADRVGFKMLDDGRKVRYFKSDGEIVDV